MAEHNTEPRGEDAVRPVRCLRCGGIGCDDPLYDVNPGSRPTFTSAPHRTFDIGNVHVGKPVSQRAIEGVWECADDCPHPAHRDIEAPSHHGSTPGAGVER